MDIEGLLNIIAGASWLAVMLVIGLIVARASRQQSTKGLNGALVLVILVAIAISVVSAGVVFIDGTERGVVRSAWPGAEGVRSEPLQPGLNWIIPGFETVIIYNITNQTYTMSIAHSEGQISGDDSVEARTSDGQVVRVDASVIFSVDPLRVVDVYKRWEHRYVDDLIRPTSRGVIRDAVSQFAIEEVYSTHRLDMTQIMFDEMEALLAENGLILQDFVLRNVSFSDEYANSVEQKQIAEQKAQEAAFVVQQKEQEALQEIATANGAAQARVIQAQAQADALIIQATAEAEALVIGAQAAADSRLIQAAAEAKALELIAAALKDNPDLLQYLYIDKLAPSIKVMIIPGDSPFLFPLPDLESVDGMQ